MADEHANPFILATDLLSQAEHGPDSPAVLITNSKTVGERTIAEVDRLLKILPTADIAGVSWDRLGEVNVVDNFDEAYKLADEYAYEHVQILTQRPREALEKMSNYGALFLGERPAYHTAISTSEPITSFPLAGRLDTQVACGLVNI